MSIRVRTASLLLVRVDASATIGTGHLMRCIALAQAWFNTGGRVRFLLAESTHGALERLRRSGFEFHLIGDKRGSERDAISTIEQAISMNASWVVADGYCFDESWQRVIKKGGVRLLVLDDFGHAKHYAADVILNQNLLARHDMYQNRDTQTQVLLGPKYALLRKEFVRWADWTRPSTERASHILVTMGGSDPNNFTLTVLQAFKRVPEMEFIVLVGGSNPNIEEICSYSRGNPSIRTIVDADDVPDLMASSELGVIAGGSTVWEAAFMGLPSLTVTQAQNQVDIAEELARQKFTINLGDYRRVDPASLADAVLNLSNDKPRRDSMSAVGRGLVDGFGASRVAQVLVSAQFE
jgi:UDP-2,4-diacetamido-2,4,6-trideoxy-beta-L-altropyranose hydrolase